MKPKTGRFGYRDWVAATVGDGNDDEKALFLAAENVHLARHDRVDALSNEAARQEARIRVAGWAMNNMEAISISPPKNRCRYSVASSRNHGFCSRWAGARHVRRRRHRGRIAAAGRQDGARR